jgi:glycine cleavage system H protein
MSGSAWRETWRTWGSRTTLRRLLATSSLSTVEKGDEIATIESVKAASPIYCPVSGDVTETNAALDAQPELVNKGAYAAFIFAVRITDSTELDGLLDASAYRKVVEREKQKH